MRTPFSRGFAALILAASAASATTAAAAEPADSASAAIATVWGEIFRPALERDYGDSTGVAAEYVAGIRETLTANPDPRMRGRIEGSQLGARLAEIEAMGVKLNRETFLTAFLDALEGRPTGFTSESANAFMNAYMERCQKNNTPDDNGFTEKQREFISRNAAREGVVTTPSGLVFEVITEGEGNSPTVDDMVTLYYTGRLADGTVFDQTEPGKPAVFPAGRLIKGFTEGLTMMKPGGTYRLFIPAELAYGQRGAGTQIPPGAALEFIIELLKTEPAK